MANFSLPVYRYLFNHAIVQPGVWGPKFAFMTCGIDAHISSYTFCEGYACHGVELVFVFGTSDRMCFFLHLCFFCASSITILLVMGRNLTADEVVLTNQMMAYWGNFAKTGNPNGEGLTGACTEPNGPPAAHTDTEWPEFTTENDLQLYMGTPCNYAAPDSRAGYCEFWQNSGFRY